MMPTWLCMKEQLQSLRRPKEIAVPKIKQINNYVLRKELTIKKHIQPSDTVLVHSDQYAEWIFEPSHPTQGRRFINARNLFVKLMADRSAPFTEVQPRLASRAELELVHAPHFIDQVLNDHICGEWKGQRSDLSTLASTFAGGTLVALDALLNKGALTAIHFPGAKHHAQYDRSSGFCVFNDFAIAATIATQNGYRVAIFDCDAHHGDGTENLLRDNPDVLTFSVHESGIFPFVECDSYDPEHEIFNYKLPPKCGDDELENGVEFFLEEAERFKPDIIFIACGADGLKDDPLSNLRYTVEGYAKAMKTIRKAYPDTPILFGGAGGYLPDDGTPNVWAQSALVLEKKRKGIEMATSNKKPTKKHFVEIPKDISEMSDAQIKAWAKEVYNQLIPVLKAEESKEENGDNT